MYKKKSLGQHFLHNRHYLTVVADAAHIEGGERIVEIGPGDGALTEELLARGARVTALEKDARLIPLLQEKFAEKNFEVLEGDALEYAPTFNAYKAIGNIPYYITGALLRKFLSGTRQPGTLVFLIQKEVAARIAREKKESILSLSVKAYGTPRYVASVPRGAFSPPPAVDSAVLAVENISRKNFASAAHEKKFFELLKKGFSSKRKLLRGNLGLAPEALEAAGIPANARAEDVPLTAWLSLSKARGR